MHASRKRRRTQFADEVGLEHAAKKKKTAPTTSASDLLINCSCGISFDDGKLMVSCDKCLVWSHVGCRGLNKKRLPEIYMCPSCAHGKDTQLEPIAFEHADKKKKVVPIKPTDAPKSEPTAVHTNTPSTPASAPITALKLSCSCGVFSDDGQLLVSCDKCLVWSHVGCIGLDKHRLPEKYMCASCAHTDETRLQIERESPCTCCSCTNAVQFDLSLKSWICRKCFERIAIETHNKTETMQIFKMTSVELQNVPFSRIMYPKNYYRFVLFTISHSFSKHKL